MSTRSPSPKPARQAPRSARAAGAHAPAAVAERYAEELKLWVVLSRAHAAVGRHSETDTQCFSIRDLIEGHWGGILPNLQLETGVRLKYLMAF